MTDERTPPRRRPCLCEHASHWVPVDDEHSYGVPADDVEHVETRFGVFPICRQCRQLQHDKPMMARELPVTRTD